MKVHIRSEFEDYPFCGRDLDCGDMAVLEDSPWGLRLDWDGPEAFLCRTCLRICIAGSHLPREPDHDCDEPGFYYG